MMWSNLARIAASIPGATRHPEGATRRQAHGAGWWSDDGADDASDSRVRSSPEAAAGRRRFWRRDQRRFGCLGFCTGAAGGGPSRSTFGLSRVR